MANLSIVIPVYNAERTIESLCNTLLDLYAEQQELEARLQAVPGGDHTLRRNAHSVGQSNHTAGNEPLAAFRTVRRSDFREDCQTDSSGIA